MGGVYMDKSQDKVKTLVKRAETNIKKLKRDGGGVIGITTSQLRKFLSRVVVLKQLVDKETRGKKDVLLSDELVLEIQRLKIMLLYQAAKDTKSHVKDFIRDTEIVELVDWIEDKPNHFDIFCKYVEALVAYHRYYGGKDK